MASQNVKILKTVVIAFLAAFLLGVLGIFIFMKTATNQPTLGGSSDSQRDVLKSIESDINLINLGEENDGFVEIDQEISKL